MIRTLVARTLSVLLVAQQILLATPARAGVTTNLQAGKPLDSRGLRSANQEARTSPSVASNPFTGESTMQIPIVVPPGTGGLTPGVALSYSSARSQSDGPLGVGWSLDVGPSVIQRSTRDGAPSYGAADEFEIDGRLLKSTGTAGRYVTELFDHSRVEHITGSGQDYWRVLRPDGLRLYFGYHYAPSANPVNLSRNHSAEVRAHEPTPAACGSNPFQACFAREVIVPAGIPFAWHLDRVEDRNGNVVRLRWDSLGDSGARYLVEIAYSEHVGGGVNAVPSFGGANDGTLTRTRVVRFLYDAVRLDRLPTYRSGFARQVTRRLGEIRVEVDGVLSGHYRLAYEQSPISGRSRLTQVADHGSHETAPAPFLHDFTYGNGGAYRWSAKDTRFALPAGLAFVSSNQDTGIRLVDVNGDAYPDVVRANAGTRQTYLGGPNGFATTPSAAWELPVDLRNAAGFTGAEFGDFDGDGRPDLLRRSLAASGVNVATGTACGTSRQNEVGTLTANAWLNTGAGWAASAADNPGNYPFSTTSYAFTGSAQSCPRENLNAMTDLQATPVDIAIGFDQGTRVADVNGDGLDDLLFKRALAGVHSQGNLYWEQAEYRAGTLINQPNGLASGVFNNAHDGWSYADDPQVVTDVLFAKHYDSPLWQVPLSNDFGVFWSNFNTCQATQNASVGAHSGKERIADLNGDGLPEILESAYYQACPSGGGACSTGPEYDLRAGWVNNGYGWQPRAVTHPEVGILAPYHFYGVTQAATYLDFYPNFTQCTDWDLGAASDFGRRIVDVNGDGGPDILGGGAGTDVMRWDATVPGGANPYLWTADASWTTPVSFAAGNGQDSGARLADVNADGMVDLVVSDGAFLNLAEPPDRLATATGPFGAVTTVSYEPSTVYAVPAATTSEPGQRTHDRPVWVVDRIETSAGAAYGQPAIVQEFEYYGPVYDEEDRAFRGFQHVAALGPIVDGVRSVTVTSFHVRDALRGMAAKTLVGQAPASDTSDVTTLYETLHTYAAASAAEATATVFYPNGTTASLASVDNQTQAQAFTPFRSLVTGSPQAASAFLALPIATQVDVYEGQSTPASSLTEQSFDLYGNVTSRRDKGDPADPDDDVTTATLYAVADGTVGGQTLLLANRPWQVQVTGVATGLPAGTVVERITQVFYDNSTTLGAITRGNATGVWRAWQTGPPAYTWVRVNQVFDVYGNTTQRSAPYDVANPGTVPAYAIAWDTTSKTFPTSFTTLYAGQAQYQFQTTLAYETAGCGGPRGMGLVCRTTHPTTAETTSTYDNFGREIATTGPIGWETATSYFDGARRTVNQRTETRVRWSTSAPPAATDPEAIIETTWYDGLGRDRQLRKRGRGSDLATATIGYDAAGRPAQATRWAYSGVGPATTYRYDVLGRLVERVQPEGASTVLVYAPRAVETQRYDGSLKNRRVERTDAFGRLAAVEEYPNVTGAPVTTTYAYDPFGSMVRVRDAMANDPALCGGLDAACTGQRHETRVFYDELGNRIRLEDPDSGAWLTKWNGRGQVVEETDPRGMRHSFAYDPLGRLERRSLVAPANPSVVDHVFTYAPANHPSSADRGKLIRIDDQEGYEELYYDFAGNVRTHVRTIGGKYFHFVHNHDPLGRRTRTTYPDGSRVDWHYDKRLLARIDPTSGPDIVSDLQYDALDRATTLDLGGSTGAPVVSEARTYEPTSGRLDLIRATAGSTVLADLDYGIDGLGRVSGMVHGTQSTSGSFVSRLYGFQYDGLDRLTWALGPYSADESSYYVHTFSNDAIGNLRSKDVGAADGGWPTLQYADPNRPHAMTAALDGSGVTQRELRYDAAGNVSENRVRSGSAWIVTPFSYDELGNLVGLGNTTMGYDASGERIRLVQGQSKLYFPEPDYEYLEAGSTKRVNRHYFVGGRRVASTFSNWTAPSASAPPAWTWRGPDLPDVPPWAWGVLYAGTLAGLAAFAWRRRRDGSFSPAFRGAALAVLAASTPMLVAGGTPPGTLGTHAVSQLFYVTDHLGSTVLTVQPDGTVRNRYTYEPFGDAVVQEGSSIHHRFTGGHLDPTNLYALGRRHYDPGLGRFVQPDPIVADVADPQTMNRYAYALGNPVRWVDPSGLAAEEGGGASGGIDWDWIIIFRPIWGPASPPPPPKVPNSVGHVPAGTGGGLGGFGFQEGEWDLLETLARPGDWRGAARARFGILGELGYIIFIEDIVEDLGIVFGEEVPWYHRTYTGIKAVVTGVGPGRILKAAGKLDDVIDAVRNTDKLRDAARGARNPKVREALERGRKAHEERQYPSGFEKEVPLPSGRRMDAYNPETREVLELKPNNRRAVQRGERQVNEYCQECDQVFGPGHTGRVETYD